MFIQKYPIYSGISREILDNFLLKFFQYADQRIFCLKPLCTGYMHVIRQFKCIDEILKSQFWRLLGTYFFNSTYTRVELNASIYGKAKAKKKCLFD